MGADVCSSDVCTELPCSSWPCCSCLHSDGSLLAASRLLCRATLSSSRSTSRGPTTFPAFLVAPVWASRLYAHSKSLPPRRPAFSPNQVIAGLQSLETPSPSQIVFRMNSFEVLFRLSFQFPLLGVCR